MTSFTTDAGSRGGPSSRKTSIVQREVVKQRDDIGCRMIILTTGQVLLGHSISSHGEGRGQQQQRRSWWPCRNGLRPQNLRLVTVNLSKCLLGPLDPVFDVDHDSVSDLKSGRFL